MLSVNLRLFIFNWSISKKIISRFLLKEPEKSILLKKPEGKILARECPFNPSVVHAGTNWSWNLLVSLTFLSLTSAVTVQGAFFLYGGIAVLAWLVCWLVLPETRGIPLEQMPLVFSGSLLVFRKTEEYLEF